MKITLLFLIGLAWISCQGFVFSETVEDVIEIRLNIEPVFSLSIETFMVPSAISYTDEDLLKPSRNSIVAGKNLDGAINLGALIARIDPQGGTMPLISEYQVLMRVRCDTNNYNTYHLTHTLLAPLTGEKTGVLFPETAFVAQAKINTELGIDSGEIITDIPTPVRAGEIDVIYRSGESQTEFLGSVIDVLYWITDSQKDKVYVNQRSDSYRATLVLTMTEL